MTLKLLESESESEENIDYIEKMKLIKKDIFDGDEKYKSIKEKTIFKTLNVKNDIKTIIDVFNEKIIKINDLKIIIDNKKEWLIEKLNEFEHNNIRTLQFVFESFNRLGKTILTVDFKENEGNQKKVLTELFEYLVIKSIHVKKGINRYSWKERQEFGEICLSNEEHSNYTDYIKGFRFVDDYIINSYFNKEYIIKVTKDYLNNINDFETDKDLKVIERYWIHSENELKESIENITKKIRKNQYSVNYYSQILIKLSCIEVWEMAISEIHEAVEAMENNIKNGLVKGELCDAYAYEISDKEQSKKYSEYFERLKKSFQKSKVTQTIEEIDNIMAKANSGEELKEYCYSNEIFFRENESFLSFIKSDLLVQKLQGDQIEDIYNFRYIIQRIYKGNKAEIYIFDKSLVENLIYKLNKMTIEDKVRKHAIDLLIKELQGIQF